MAILNTGKTFTDGENVTASKLNEVVNNANFAAGSVDNSTIEIHTGGYLKVKPGGIKSEELDTDSVVSVIETALTSEETTASIPTASPPSGNESGSDGFMSSTDKEKLDGIAAGAEVNVQSDWNQTDNTADDFIQNKPTIGPGSTNLSVTADGTQLKVNSDTGNDASIPAATQSAWGAMTDEDKTKLDGIAANAEVNVQADWNATSGDALILNKPTIPSGTGSTNLSTTASGTGLSVNSDTGNNASIPAASQTAWGAMTDDDKSKLDGIAASANNYSHPTGDGNLHVPATGTSNNGKVLTAGSSAGSLSWQTPDDFNSAYWSYFIWANSPTGPYYIKGTTSVGYGGHLVGSTNGEVPFASNVDIEVTHNLGTNRIGYAVRIEMPGGSPRQIQDITGSGVWGSTVWGTRLISAGSTYSNSAKIRLFENWLDWTSAGSSNPVVKNWDNNHVYNIVFAFWALN